MLSLFLSVIFFLNLVIQDNKTNEGIPGAQAVCLDHKEGGMADTTGTIRLQVKPGKHRFRVSHIGYKSQTINLNLTQDNATVIVLLESRTIPMPEIMVTDSRILNSEAKIINYQSIIRQIPVAEPDVLRALQTLPSVSAASDWGSVPAIRGLSPNYTHIYLGDAPILNPTHVGGLFTGLDYGMIDQAKVYPGVVPVEYGNYGSGMVQLQPRFSKTAETSVELGLISTTFRTLLSPTASWQTSLAARYFTLDYVSRLVEGAFGYHFYDLFWANRWSPAESRQIVSNIYFSRESLPNSVINNMLNDMPPPALYETVKTLPHYDNLVGTIELNWQHTRLSLYYSSTPMEMETSRNWVHNRMLKWGGRLQQSKEIFGGQFQTGLGWEETQMDYEWNFDRSALNDIIGPPQLVFFDDAPPKYQHDFSYRTLAGWMNYQRLFFKKTEISAGIRVEQVHDQWYWMPRLTGEQKLWGWSLSLGYGSVYQHTYPLKEKSNHEKFAPFTIQFPAGNNPTRIHTLNARLSPPDDRFGIEIYGRRFYRVPLYDWASYRHYWSDGFAAGMELNSHGRLWWGEWLASYTLSTSRVAWRNRWLQSNQDRPHQLKLNWDFPFGNRWRLGLQFQFASGYPYSTVTHWLPIYSGNDFVFTGAPMDFIPRFGDPNNANYPAYHRLDLSLEKVWNVGDGKLTGQLSILNLYNHKNVYYYGYEYEFYFLYAGIRPTATIEKVPNFPLLPTIHLAYQF